jgi:hypothetical protein
VFVAIGLVVCLRAVVVAFGLVINESSRSRSKKKKKKIEISTLSYVIVSLFPEFLTRKVTFHAMDI